MDLDYFTRLRQGPVARLIRWLQHRSLLANPLHCSGCNRDMELVEREAGHVDSINGLFPSLLLLLFILFWYKYQIQPCLINIGSSTSKGKKILRHISFYFTLIKSLDAMIIKDERVQKRGHVGISPNKGVLPPKKWRQAKGRRFFGGIGVFKRIEKGSSTVQGHPTRI